MNTFEQVLLAVGAFNPDGLFPQRVLYPGSGCCLTQLGAAVKPFPRQRELGQSKHLSPFAMNKVRLNLGKLSVPQLISYAQRVRAALERNPAFSRHNDDLRLLEEEIIELAERHEDLDEAVKLAQERAAERDVLRGSVEALLGDLAEEVAELSRQHPELLRRSGFDPLSFRHAHPEIALEQSPACRGFA